MKLIPLMQNLARNLYGYEYKARKTMFKGLVHTHFTYCSSVYYHRLQVKTLQRHVTWIQRRCNIIGARAYSDIPAEMPAC